VAVENRDFAGNSHVPFPRSQGSQTTYKVRAGGTTPLPPRSQRQRAWLPTRQARGAGTDALERGHTDPPPPTHASTRARAREVLCRECKIRSCAIPGQGQRRWLVSDDGSRVVRQIERTSLWGGNLRSAGRHQRRSPTVRHNQLHYEVTSLRSRVRATASLQPMVQSPATGGWKSRTTRMKR
jgi:hypothetical protein